MADKAIRVYEVDEAALGRMVRKDIAFPEDMDPWVRSAARHHGLTVSAMVRMLVAAELNRIFGPGWADPQTHDHPEGDHEGKPLAGDYIGR